MDLHDCIEKGLLRILVKVGCSRTEITGFEDGIVKLDIKARPEKGRVNAEIVRFFSKKLKKKVEIKSGFTSRNKTIRIL